MRKAILVLLTSVALTLGFVAPAQADARTVRDTGQDYSSLARTNILRVRYNNGDRAFTIKVVLQRVRRERTVIFSDMHMYNDEGYVFEAWSRWKDGHRIDRLYVWYNTDSKTRVRCGHLSSRWDVGRHGSVRIRIPQNCLFKGATWDRLRTITATSPKQEEGNDIVSSAPPLAQG